jgi:RHS repeat-associated protein
MQLRAGSIQSFAGLTQNLVPDEYETPNREYNPTQGRWITPDPSGLAAVDPTNPQSWNRYAYVLNNPLSATDPTGLFCAYAVVGWAWAGYQGVHALYEGGKAYKESIDQCYGGG